MSRTANFDTSVFCKEDCPHYRVGLPIFPVRYAVMPDDAPLAPLDAAFKGDQTAIELGAAQYSLRKLRAGYLYVYDEKMKRLDGYRIDEYGILYRMSLADQSLPVGADVGVCSIPSIKVRLCVSRFPTRRWQPTFGLHSLT